MEKFIRQHLNEYDKNTKEIDIIVEELIQRFKKGTDIEKKKIIEIINLLNKQELSDHPKLKEIREWTNPRN